MALIDAYRISIESYRFQDFYNMLLISFQTFSSSSYLYVVLPDAYKIPIDADRISRFLYEFTDLSPICLKLVINLHMVLTDAYETPIDAYRFLKMSTRFVAISQILLKLVINLYMVLIYAYKIPMGS